MSVSNRQTYVFFVLASALRVAGSVLITSSLVQFMHSKPGAWPTLPRINGRVRLQMMDFAGALWEPQHGNLAAISKVPLGALGWLGLPACPTVTAFYRFSPLPFARQRSGLL